MFSPLDILYIVLAFCALWFTAAIFWLIWQIASIFRNVNETLAEAREKMVLIEKALTGIRQKFESTTSVLGVVVETASKTVDYLLDKKKEPKKKKPRKKGKVIDL